MNQEDIVRMAEEAGIRLAWQSDAICPKNVYVHELLRFANLAAQQEREACAKIAETAEPYQTADLIRARGQA